MGCHPQRAMWRGDEDTNEPIRKHAGQVCRNTCNPVSRKPGQEALTFKISLKKVKKQDPGSKSKWNHKYIVAAIWSVSQAVQCYIPFWLKNNSLGQREILFPLRQIILRIPSLLLGDFGKRNGSRYLFGGLISQLSEDWRLRAKSENSWQL